MTLHAPVRDASLRRVAGPALVGLAGAAAALALVVRDPHVPGSWGSCVVHDQLGLWCPGCGGLRAVNDLLRLDVGAAVASNAVAVVLVLLVALWWSVWSWSALARRRLPWERWVTPGRVWAAVAVVLAFTVLRNVPGLEALAP